MTAKELSCCLNIGMATAKKTLQSTTHQCVRSTEFLTRRLKTEKSQLWYKQLTCGYGTFYTDYLKSSVK